MGETRKQLKERLQAAGRWQEYLELRERLGKGGLTPAQASRQALAEIELRPPKVPEPLTSVTEPVPVDEELPDFNGQAVPNHEAAQWVAENVANSKVRAEDAPSALAWGLLKWVRLSPANQSTFWSSIWPKLLPTGTSLRQQEEKSWNKNEPCPTCGSEPEDESDRRLRNLLAEGIQSDKERQAEDDARLAEGANAEAIGTARQKELREALYRERMLLDRLNDLKRQADDPEDVMGELFEGFYATPRTHDMELALLPNPAKVISSLANAIIATVEREKQWQQRIDAWGQDGQFGWQVPGALHDGTYKRTRPALRDGPFPRTRTREDSPAPRGYPGAVAEFAGPLPGKPAGE
jgi:hypothetical protein